MKKVPRSRVQLEASVMEQLDFLERSCEAYDRGYTAEAKRMTVPIRILIHDTNQSHSLLGQLGELNVRFFDTLMPLTGTSMLPEMGLVVHHFSRNGIEFAAPLDTAAKQTTTIFEEWWNGTICKMPDGAEVSRKSLVLTAANQDGGAHVDPALDGLYHRLVHENALGYTLSGEGCPEVPMGDPTKAALRQITHEVLKTLKSGYGRSFVPTGMVISNIAISTQPPPHIARIHYQGPGRTKTPPDMLCPCGSGAPYNGCHDKS